MALDLSEKIISDIQKIASKYPVARIVLFGSRARGDNKAYSDIDIAVFPLAEFNGRGGFSSDMDDLATLLKIDLVFVDAQTDAALLERIDREGVNLYEQA